MQKRNVIVGPPSEELLRMQNEGHLVLCELKELQGLPEEEVEKILREDSTLWQYKNVCIDAGCLPQAYFNRLWYRHHGLPVQIAETKRLYIRESTIEDATAFQALYADKDVQKFLEKLPLKEESLSEYEEYIKQYAENQYPFYEYGMWSVVEKSSGNVIGRMGLEQQVLPNGQEVLSLGYALLPQYRGNGYALEACLAILDYCKECDYEAEVFVKMDAENTESRKLFQKLSKYSKMVLVEM